MGGEDCPGPPPRAVAARTPQRSQGAMTGTAYTPSEPRLRGEQQVLNRHQFLARVDVL